MTAGSLLPVAPSLVGIPADQRETIHDISQEAPPLRGFYRQNHGAGRFMLTYLPVFTFRSPVTGIHPHMEDFFRPADLC